MSLASPPPSFSAALAAGRASTEEALAIFDALEAVATADLPGSWSGEEFPTGHPMDGALAAYRWQGKRFDGEEHAHPLLFRTWAGTLALRPGWVAPFLPLLMKWRWLLSPPMAALARAGLPLFATRRSRARLRMTRHRGVLTATMIYDEVPIQDVFRQVDRDTLLGLMDRKGMARPYFFVLRRERSSPTRP
jgi:hypothetical protein